MMAESLLATQSLHMYTSNTLELIMQLESVIIVTGDLFLKNESKQINWLFLVL